MEHDRYEEQYLLAQPSIFRVAVYCNSDVQLSLGVMRWRIPQRLSAEWWSWLAGGAFAFGACTAAVLFWRGIFTDPIPLILLALVGSAIGDLLMAASFEVIAPSRVTLGPGERVKKNDDILELATVVSGFNDSAAGRVRARGEIWGARCYDGTPLSLAAGVKLRIVERDGLTLLVRLP